MVRKNRAKDWFMQAEDDLSWAFCSFEGEKYAQTCFICQQIAEKALKALALNLGAYQVRSHSLRTIAEELKINGEIEKAALVLDQYYISARYPDAFAEGMPSYYFTKEQAEHAISLAKIVLDTVRSELEK